MADLLGGLHELPAGVVDEHVERAVARRSPQRRAPSRPRARARRRRSAGSRRRRRGSRPPSPRAARPAPGDRDARAERGEQLGRRAADAGAAAGDERGAAGEAAFTEDAVHAADDTAGRCYVVCGSASGWRALGHDRRVIARIVAPTGLERGFGMIGRGRGVPCVGLRRGRRAGVPDVRWSPAAPVVRAFPPSGSRRRSGRRAAPRRASLRAVRRARPRRCVPHDLLRRGRDGRLASASLEGIAEDLRRRPRSRWPRPRSGRRARPTRFEAGSCAAACEGAARRARSPRAARLAPAEVVERLGRPVVGHERAQRRLAIGPALELERRDQRRCDRGSAASRAAGRPTRASPRAEVAVVLRPAV